MREKCIKLRNFYYDHLLKEINGQIPDELALIILAGQSVIDYCDFMLMFGNSDYDWESMKNNLLYKGTGVEW